MLTPYRFILTVLFTILIAFGPVAKAEAGSISVIGAGAGSCTSWNKNFAKGAYFRDMGVSWVLGYLAGVATEIQSNVLSTTSADAVGEAMDAQCRIQPNANIAQVAHKLIENMAQ